jgi:hypothetical protein
VPSAAEPIFFHEDACSSPDCSTTYKLTEILHESESKFCKITVGVSEIYGRTLFLDREIQSASSDEAIYHEHLVHPVMSATFAPAAAPRRVLIIGGGEGATAREVLRWKDVGKVDMVDIDGELIEICKDHLKCVASEGGARARAGRERERFASESEARARVRRERAVMRCRCRSLRRCKVPLLLAQMRFRLSLARSPRRGEGAAVVRSDVARCRCCSRR